MSQIERNEMEERTKERGKRKKNPVESLHLTKDDLSVKRSGIDIAITPLGDVQISPGVDMVAGFEAAMGAAAEAAGVVGGVDVQV
jgi:hypothetical protein